MTDSASFTRLNLGCGTDQRKGPEWLNVDAVEECDPDLLIDLNEYPWPFDDNSIEFIFASHVFEHLDDVEGALKECNRILQKQGQLEIRLPMGLDMRSDPDHRPNNEWTWRTPVFYAGARHWDSDVGLTLQEREVELWVQQPGLAGWLQKQKINYLIRRHGPGEWCFGLESTSGEYIVKYKKVRK